MNKKNDSKKEITKQNYTESRETPYCMVKRYGSITFDETLEQLKEGLGNEGFDVFAEIDIKDYLKSYVKNISQFKILMVCHKKTAADLISMDVQMTTLIPCKISIQDMKDEGLVEVSIEDTEVIWSTANNDGIQKISTNVKKIFSSIMDGLGPKNVKL